MKEGKADFVDVEKDELEGVNFLTISMRKKMVLTISAFSTYLVTCVVLGLPRLRTTFSGYGNKHPAPIGSVLFLLFISLSLLYMSLNKQNGKRRRDGDLGKGVDEGKCSICGEILLVPLRCSQCGKTYCVTHLPPEGHGCEKQAKGPRARETWVCALCGKHIWQPVWKPYTCSRCGLILCRNHLPPDKHSCTHARKNFRRRYATYLSAVTIILAILVLALLFLSRNRQGAPVKALILTFNRSAMMLYDYNATGSPVQVWAARIFGLICSVTFCDLDSDANPEIVASTGPHVDSTGQQIGVCTLLVYQNISGTYELVVNETGPGSTTLDIARARVIDYYGNGTNFLITILARKFVLVRYVPGEPTVRVALPYEPKLYSFDVGDVNNDDKPDIVYNGGLGLIVLENQGGGRYSSKRLPEKASPSPVDEIRIGDVDGDGRNDIVAVGYGFQRSPFWVYKSVDGEYRAIFGNLTMPQAHGAIQSVDIGDVDGDGRNEIVTSAPFGNVEPVARNLSVWKFKKRGGSFRIVWEDNSTLGPQGMLCLRTAPPERSGEAKIVGIHGGSLYIVDREGSRYRSRTTNLFWYLDVWTEGLDVWSQVAPIKEPE